MFHSKKFSPSSQQIDQDFVYLEPNSCYLDYACPTLRPQPVIDTKTEYYLQYNACGGRMKYKWGTIVDEKAQKAKKLLLQLKAKDFTKIVTTDIEHTSVNLPTMTWAKRSNAMGKT